MPDWLPALVFGSSLTLIALALMRWHFVSWNDQKKDETLNDFDRNHFAAQYRRRMQTSAMVAVVGLLIPLGDLVFQWFKSPVWFGIYWCVVLVLVFWVALLGFGDRAATRAYTDAAMGNLNKERVSYEAQLADLKKRYASETSSEAEPDQDGDR